MNGDTKKITILFMLITYVIIFELCVVLPLAPRISEIYGINASNISMLNLGYAIAGLFAPIFGFIADKHGVKKTMIISTLLFTFGALVMGFGEKAIFYVAARFLIGLGYYSLIGIIYSYTALIVEENKLGRISGYYKIFFGLAILTSPVLGSFMIENYSIAFIYRVLAASSIVCLIGLLILKFPDKRMEKMDFNDVKFLIKNKTTILCLLMTFFLCIPAIVFYNYYSIHLESIGMTQMEIGQMYVFISFGTLLAGFLILLFSDKLGKLKFVIFGVILCLIGILPLSTSTKTLLLIFSFIWSLGYDIIWGLHSTMAALIYKKATGTFLTMISLAMAFTNIFSNIVSPFLYRAGGFRLNTIVCFISLVLTGILYIKVYYIDRKL